MPLDSRLYVGNLPPDVKEREIEDIFYKFGKIVEIDVKLKGPRTYAFVEFDDPRDADDACYDRDGYKFDGYRLRVEFCKGSRRSVRAPSPPRRTEYRVLVKGLPESGSWQDLKDHMKYAGPIAFADVYKDGTGIVEYVHYEDMKYAIRRLDDTKFKSHLGETGYIQVDEDRPRRRTSSYGGHSSGYHSSRKSFSRSPSRSRSRSPTPYSDRSPSRSRSRSPF